MATTWDRPSKGDSNDQHGNDAAENDENNMSSQQLSKSDSGGGDDHDNNDDLPPGWEAVLDPSSGDYYYAHESTGETQWEKPEFNDDEPYVAEDSYSNNQSSTVDDNDNDDGLASDDNLPEGWFSAVDEDSGDQYYCNEGELIIGTLD